MSTKPRSLFDPQIVLPAIKESFIKLSPTHMWKNPVMFVTEIGAAVTTMDLFFQLAHHSPFSFVLQITIWLWFTVVFANFAEAMAEGRGKAQADTLRKSRTSMMAARNSCPMARSSNGGMPRRFARATSLSSTANELIAADGEIIEGAASVNESAITGESAPGHPRSWWRSLGRDRRHHRAFRPDQSPRHRQPR